MKTFKTTIKKFMTIILTVLVILIFNSCEDFIEDEIILLDSSSSEQLISWNKLLNQLDLKSKIAFVQDGESIQDALDAAFPRDIIYIEQGTYHYCKMKAILVPACVKNRIDISLKHFRWRLGQFFYIAKHWF